MLIIGLTGGIGSGKTQATNHFAALGINIVDADIASRVIVEPGQPALAEIAAAFGSGVIDAAGGLNRAALRNIVFASPEQRQALERITHPRIALELQRQLQASTSAYTILVSPLLFESGQHRYTQRTLLIDAPESLQQARASLRDGVTAEHISAIIAAQMSREERRLRADDIVTNDSGLPQFYAALTYLHHQYLALAHVKP